MGRGCSRNTFHPIIHIFLAYDYRNYQPISTITTKTMSYKRFPDEIWIRAEALIREGKGIRPTEAILETEFGEAPSHVSILQRARTFNWLTEAKQAETIMEGIKMAGDALAADPSPLRRSRILDTAMRKLNLADVYRDHAGDCLETLKIAQERIREALQDRDLGPSARAELTSAVGQLTRAYVSVRELLEGKRPNVAVQVNQGAREVKTAVLIPASCVRKPRPAQPLDFPSENNVVPKE